MKWLVIGTAALVIIALGLARRRSARVHLLESSRLRLVVRVAAILLVCLGLDARAQEPEEVDEKKLRASEPRVALPDAEKLQRWYEFQKSRRIRAFKAACLDLLTRAPKEAAPLPDFRQEFAMIPASFAKLLREELERRSALEPAVAIDAGRLGTALADLEEAGLHDQGLLAIAFSLCARVESSERRLDLLRAIARQSVLADALAIALGRQKPIVLDARAWASKAGPSRHIRRAEKTRLTIVAAELRTILAEKRRSSWTEDARTSFRLVSGRLVLEGLDLEARRRISAGEVFEFSRFDGLEVGDKVVLQHAWLGELMIEEKGRHDVFSLPEVLDAAHQEKIRACIDDALLGDETADGLLQLSLPLVHRELQHRLAMVDEAPGAAALRMNLRLFDELITHPIETMRIERGKAEDR